MKLKLHNYKLKTVSSLVLSPREAQAFYVNENNRSHLIGSGLKSGKDVNKVKVIYPFYQYGNYSEYNPKNSQYYIPGSSIKGAICSGIKNKNTLKMLVDDIPIHGKDLYLEHLYKLQRSGEKLELDTFFPNTFIEMLKAESEYVGQIYSNIELKNILCEVQKATTRKLEQLLTKLKQDLELITQQETMIKVNQLLTNVMDILSKIKTNNEQKYTILLGGYKGLILSLTNVNHSKVSSAVYIDQSSNLPYGLVELDLLDNKKGD